MPKTIFERIVDREAEADIIYEDEHVLAFRDITPRPRCMFFSFPNSIMPATPPCLPNTMLSSSTYSPPPRKSPAS